MAINSLIIVSAVSVVSAAALMLGDHVLVHEDDAGALHAALGAPGAQFNTLVNVTNIVSKKFQNPKLEKKTYTYR